MENQRPLSEVVELDLQPNDDIPEENEDTSDDAANTFAPPERIAARFYRPSVTRRKSSAASSRRNSMTSNHSQISNSSYRQACRNNHVAQYLRRASIIEGRKQRLQAREAHAEQVRIRAALAKSAPRASNSEERALAAQRAREEHLAKVAGACAEEVRRAKEKAEQMKKQRAAEEERYRLEMEEKQAEVQKRRLEYKRNALRRPRGASTSPNSEVKKPVVATLPLLDEGVAAERIQIAWRTRRRKNILTAFNNLGLSIDLVHDATFEDVSAKLLDPNVLSISKQLMELYDLPSNDEALTVADPNKTTRNFLTAFLILGHPTDVFSQDGEQEKDVMTKAKDLILCFEEVLSKSTASNRYTPAATLLENLHLAHIAYLQTFGDWKAQDASTLIEIMVGSFVNLDAIWQNVKDDTDGEVAADYRDGIRENQILLYARLKKLAGSRADMLIRKAIQESRRKNANARRKPVGDVRPRVAVEQAIHPEASTTGSSVDVIAETTSNLSPSARTDDGFQHKLIQKLFSVVPENRIVTHELAIDKSWRMDTECASEIRNELNRQMCEAMLQGFKDGDGSKWTKAMAENIRGKLLHLVGGGQTRTLISEVLDMDVVDQQCRQGIFSYQKFFSFMATLLPKLCAPVRDEEVKALAEELQQEGDLDAMILKLSKLLRMIDLFSLDNANYMLMKAAPTLIQQSSGYEQRRFAEDLDQGRITLQKTKRWWHNANVNCLTEIDQRDPRGSPTVQKIYARGLVDLTVASTPLKSSEVPETLHLDEGRLSKIRSDAVRITIIAAILLTAKNLLKRDVRQQWKLEASRIWEVLRAGYGKDDDSIPARVHSIIESTHPMPPSTNAQLQGTITRLLPQAESGKFTDPVVKVLFQRLKTHIFNRISASSSGERVRVASSAGEGLATSGLPEFMTQVGEIVVLLGKVSDVDRKAHGVWYAQVAAEVEAMGEPEGAGANPLEAPASPPAS